MLAGDGFLSLGQGALTRPARLPLLEELSRLLFVLVPGVQRTERRRSHAGYDSFVPTKPSTCAQRNAWHCLEPKRWVSFDKGRISPGFSASIKNRSLRALDRSLLRTRMRAAQR